MERIAQTHPDIHYNQRRLKITPPSASHRIPNLKREPGPLSILAIHASAVQVNGGALLFLGPSGTGKSTMCHFLSAYTRTLALDAVFLIHRAGIWEVANGDGRAFGRPPSGQETSKLKGVPLRAIFRLYQAPAPLLRLTDDLTTCCFLTDAFFEIARQRKNDLLTKKTAFSKLAAIAESVPGYQLYSDLSPLVLTKLDDTVGFCQNQAQKGTDYGE